MIARRAAKALAIAGLGLAGISLSALAPAPAQAQDAQVLPSDPQDFQCFVLLQQRREAFIANRQLPTEQRAEFINNLTIISAFYAGRISHYPAGEAVSQFQSAVAQVNAATPEQRDAFANICSNFYVSVLNVLTTTRQQVATPQQQ